jgi:Neprosin
MKNRVMLISRIALIALMVWLSAGVLANPALAAPQDHPSSAFQCVKRIADHEPPRASLPSLRALDGRQQESEPARKLEPVCPVGEVPVTPPDPRHFIKGNPLIGPYAQPGPAHPLPGAFVNKNLLLPFDQVYWKREGEPTKPNSPSINGSGDAPCNGVAWFGSCFFYASAAEQRVADGGGMTLQIESPIVDNSGDEGGHSIGQIAVMGPGTAGGSLDDVEMGFSVSPDQWGDNDPHLFVYHFNDGAETCYDTCNWNQYSSTYFPGMDLKPLVGQLLYIGWVQYQGAWWAWFNDQWLGYIEDSAWATTFTQTAQIQWYGEVASNNGIPPKTQMGNGELPSNTKAANMETLCDVDAKAWVCFYRNLQSTGATHVSYYDILNHTSFGAVRYGGPGQ